MGYRIEVVTDDCMSSGKCVADYPEAFMFDDNELAVLVPDRGPMTDDDKVRAARNCPSQALQLFDDAGNQIAT